MTITRFQGVHSFLSNFWPAMVVYDGMAYPTIEHAYQAAKFPKEKRKTFQQGTAGRAKRMGRRPGKREDWDEIKLGVMREVVTKKFTELSDMRARLLATGTQDIEEGNTWGDVFWGKDLVTGEGENHLGRILMDVRRALQETQ